MSRRESKELKKLDELVNSISFREKEIDRLLSWEILQSFCVGNWNHPVQPEEFCDRIGVNIRYTNRVMERVREKLSGQKDLYL